MQSIRRLLLISVLGVSALTLSGCRTSTVDQATQIQPPVTDSSVSLARAAELNIQLGLAYMGQGRMDIAKRKLLKAQNQAPELPSVYYSLGYYYQEVGQTNEANNQYQKALRIAPKNPNVLNSYGVFLCDTGQYKTAISYFMKAISQTHYTNVGIAYENAGLCARKMGDVSKAKQFFNLAVKQNPNLPNSYLNLAELEIKQHRYEVAQRFIQRYNFLASPVIRSVEVQLAIAHAAHDSAKISMLELQLESLKSRAEIAHSKSG